MFVNVLCEYTNNCHLSTIFTYPTIPNHILCSAYTVFINTMSFRMHELATISVQMIPIHIRGIPMIGSTATVHVVPGKLQLHVIMVFVVPVLHMTQKSPVSDWIGWIWIYRKIDEAIQQYLMFVLYIFTFYMLRIYC